MEKTMGMRIRECRMKLGMTQEELAGKLFLDKRTISAYEHDKIDVKVSLLKEMAEILETRVGYLVDGEVEDVNNNLGEFGEILKTMDLSLRKVAIEQLKALSKLQL